MLKQNYRKCFIKYICYQSYIWRSKDRAQQLPISKAKSKITKKPICRFNRGKVIWDKEPESQEDEVTGGERDRSGKFDCNRGRKRQVGGKETGTAQTTGWTSWGGGGGDQPHLSHPLWVDGTGQGRTEEKGNRAHWQTLPKPKSEPNVAKSHRSSAVSKYTKPTGKHTPNTPANYTPSASGRGLWDAAGVGSPASDPRRGHRGATRTGVDGDGRVFFLSFFCGGKKK